MPGMRRRPVMVWLVASAVLAGCTSSHSASVSSSSRPKTPVDAALAWFHAINHKDKAAALAAFLPSNADQMNWNGGNTASWPTFSKVACTDSYSDDTVANVYCTFKESDPLGDTFWTIHFQHATDGRWLIENYGQG